jgi:hypothetical protein
MQNLGWILLAIWLIATGLVSLLGVRFPGGETILSLLAIAAGVFMLLGYRRIKFKGNLGMLLLGIWLILSGLLPLLNFNFPALGLVLAILAVAAGVLLLLKR